MDPAQIASVALSVLVPHLARAGETLAGNAIEKLPEQVGKLWKVIADKFKGKLSAEGAIQDLLTKVDDPDNQEAFSLQLRKLMKEDPEFARQLLGVIDRMEKDGGIANFGGVVATGGSVAAGSGGIAVGGNVGGSIIIGDGNSIGK